MKNIIVIESTFLITGLYMSANSTFAADRVKVYEMAESGISVEFPVEIPDKPVADAITEKIISEDLKI